MKRIVTGHSDAGKSVFLSDGMPPRIVTLRTLPGLEMTGLWSTEGTPSLPADGDDPTMARSSSVPGPGGTRFGLIRMPGTREVEQAVTQGFDPAAFREEYLAKVPGLAECHELDNPAMHTTNTIDYVVVLDGEIWLELDDGNEIHLERGDCVVQQGTRHAWRNRAPDACLLAAVMVGATRQ